MRGAFDGLSAGEVELDLSFDPDPLEIEADGGQLTQVFANLLQNAVQAMDGRGLIRVRGRRLASRVFVSIEDDGPGIAPDDRERVFEPYETTRDEGTGLGLAIVKKVVLDHGGEISVEEGGELGGARFVIRLQSTVA